MRWAGELINSPAVAVSLHCSAVLIHSKLPLSPSLLSDFICSPVCASLCFSGFSPYRRVLQSCARGIQNSARLESGSPVCVGNPPQPGSQIAGAHLRHREISLRLEGCLFLTQKPLINTKAYGIIVGVPGRLLEITLRTACRSSMAPFPPRVARCVSSMPLNAHEWAADSLIALLCVSLDRERSVPLTESIGKARPLHADPRSLTVVFTWN